jgi:FO synthase subunit 2
VRTLDVIRALLKDVAGGHRLTEGEAESLMGAAGRDVWAIAACADQVREERVGQAVTYVRNQNINVTNICVNACGFCGFSRKQGDPDAYFFDKAVVQGKATRARERRVTEICTVSGLHPDFTADSYVNILTWIREAAPGMHLHGRDGGAPEGGRARVHVRDRGRDPGGSCQVSNLPGED